MWSWHFKLWKLCLCEKKWKETTHNQQYSCIIVVFLQDGSCNRSETQKLTRLENIFYTFRTFTQMPLMNYWLTTPLNKETKDVSGSLFQFGQNNYSDPLILSYTHVRPCHFLLMLFIGDYSWPIPIVFPSEKIVETMETNIMPNSLVLLVSNCKFWGQGCDPGASKSLGSSDWGKVTRMTTVRPFKIFQTA